MNTSSDIKTAEEISDGLSFDKTANLSSHFCETRVNRAI